MKQNLSIKTLSLVLLVGFFILGCGVEDTANDNENSTNTQSGSFSVPTITQEEKTEFLNAVNDARSQAQDCGAYGIKPAVHALSWNETLYKAAYTYNYDMDNGDAWYHVGSGTEYDIVDPNSDGSTLPERVEYYNYNWSVIGENIAKGQKTVDEVIAGWIDSDEHCINLMSPDFTEIGMSLLVGTGTGYLTTNGVTTEVEIEYNYWTQDFGKPY